MTHKQVNIYSGSKCLLAIFDLEPNRARLTKKTYVESHGQAYVLDTDGKVRTVLRRYGAIGAYTREGIRLLGIGLALGAVPARTYASHEAKAERRIEAREREDDMDELKVLASKLGVKLVKGKDNGSRKRKAKRR